MKLLQGCWKLLAYRALRNLMAGYLNGVDMLRAYISNWPMTFDLSCNYILYLLFLMYTQQHIPLCSSNTKKNQMHSTVQLGITQYRTTWHNIVWNVSFSFQYTIASLVHNLLCPNWISNYTWFKQNSLVPNVARISRKTSLFKMCIFINL